MKEKPEPKTDEVVPPKKKALRLPIPVPKDPKNLEPEVKKKLDAVLS